MKHFVFWYFVKSVTISRQTCYNILSDLLRYLVKPVTVSCQTPYNILSDLLQCLVKPVKISCQTCYNVLSNPLQNIVKPVTFSCQPRYNILYKATSQYLTVPSLKPREIPCYIKPKFWGRVRAQALSRALTTALTFRLLRSLYV